VLEVSKTLMYDYYYNVLKKFYGDRITLMYTDTGEYLYIYYLLFIYFQIILNMFQILSYLTF